MIQEFIALIRVKKRLFKPRIEIAKKKKKIMDVIYIGVNILSRDERWIDATRFLLSNKIKIEKKFLIYLNFMLEKKLTEIKDVSWKKFQPLIIVLDKKIRRN